MEIYNQILVEEFIVDNVWVIILLVTIECWFLGFVSGHIVGRIRAVEERNTWWRKKVRMWGEQEQHDDT